MPAKTSRLPIGSLRRALAVVALAAYVTVPLPVRGDDSQPEGRIRITDADHDDVVQAEAIIVDGSHAIYAEGGCSTCDHGGCPDGACGACQDHGGLCKLGHGCCGQSGCCSLCGLLRDCHRCCTHSPDHGWSPPAKYPIHRVPVVYQRDWPNRWYGAPGSTLAGGFPMVYQPTDTTQLGFYYQRTPYWLPNPGMRPAARPWPPNWHHRGVSGMSGTDVIGVANPLSCLHCLHRRHGYAGGCHPAVWGSGAYGADACGTGSGPCQGCTDGRCSPAPQSVSPGPADSMDAAPQELQPPPEPPQPLQGDRTADASQ